MTMFSESRQQFYGGSYGGSYGGGEGFMRGNYGNIPGSDLVVVPMAHEDDEEEEFTRNSTFLNDVEQESSSKKDDQGWLQLSIGGGGRNLENPRKNNGGSGLVELDLMPSNTCSSTSHLADFRPPRPVTGGPYAPPSFYHGIGGSSSSGNFHLHNNQQEINWAFRPIPISISPSSSSMASGSYFPRPFQIYDVAQAGPGVDFRVIQPPRRPHSGIWFMLQASQNQEKEPFLPQISKSYLRIKDGKMTIRLVLKYLVNKLSLENESEIEIRCKGQRLVPFLTLQHVRDNIWSSPRDFITLLPNSSTTHHIMVLHYARTTSSSSN